MPELKISGNEMVVNFSNMIRTYMIRNLMGPVHAPGQLLKPSFDRMTPDRRSFRFITARQPRKISPLLERKRSSCCCSIVLVVNG